MVVSVSGNTIFQYVCHLVHPSINAASSSFHRNAGVNCTVEHECCHGKGKSHMHKDQSNTAVQYSKDTTVKRNQRDHKYLERNNHRCNHQGKQNTACFPFITNNYKRCHCRKHNCKDRRNCSNQKRVCKRCCKVHLFHWHL